MKLRVAIVLALLSSALGCSIARAASLEVLHAYAPLGLWYWNGNVVIKEYSAASNDYSFSCFSPRNPKPHPFIVPGIEKLTDLGMADGKPVAFGQNGKTCVLMQNDGTRWHQIDLPKKITPAKKAELLPTNDGVALFTQASMFMRRTIFVLRRGKWQQITPTPPNSTYTDFGYTDYLYGSLFMAGSAGGEWNTGLHVFDIDHPSKDWSDFHPSDDQFLDMCTDSHGILWLCACGVYSGNSVYQFNGMKLKQMMNLDQSLPNWKPGSAIDQYLDVNDMMLAPDQRIYTAGYEGIFSWDSMGRRRRDVKYDLRAERRRPKNPATGKPGKLLDCDPQRMALDGKGNYYVATIHYGVLCFIKSGGGYRQLQVITPEERKQDALFYKKGYYSTSNPYPPVNEEIDSDPAN